MTHQGLMLGLIPTMPEPSVPPKLPPHVMVVRKPSGRLYYYLRPHRGTKQATRPTRLPDDPRSPEFWREYSRLMALPAPRERTDTVAALISAWQSSPEWRGMSERTQGEWTRLCRRIEASWGHLEVKGIEPRNVL